MEVNTYFMISLTYDIILLQGDFYQWVDLFNHFDTFYETFVQPRKDLRLEGFPRDEVLPLPKGALIEILRVSKKILEHCGNKHLFLSCEVKQTSSESRFMPCCQPGRDFDCVHFVLGEVPVSF